MTSGDKGRLASASNILSQHTRFLLGPVEAKAIVTNMTEQVSATWYEVVRAAGVSEKDAEAIKAAFVYSTPKRPPTPTCCNRFAIFTLAPVLDGIARHAPFSGSPLAYPKTNSMMITRNSDPRLRFCRGFPSKQK
jgi:hypothetical protein